jgi:hypothetical protein
VSDWVKRLFMQASSPTGRLNMIELEWQGLHQRALRHDQLPDLQFMEMDFSALEARAAYDYCTALLLDTFAAWPVGSVDAAVKIWFARQVRKAYGIPDHAYDVHRMTACKMFGRAYDEITDEQRKSAKVANYCRMYWGIQPSI